MPAAGDDDAAPVRVHPVTAFGPPDVRFTVQGHPVTQGSKRIGRAGGKVDGRPILLEDHHNELKSWRTDVEIAARLTLGWGWQPLIGPIACSIAFGLSRPPSHPKRARTWPTGRMDIEKLVRAVHDALTEAKVWRDDGQVIAEWTIKEWWHLVPGLERPGAAVSLWRITDSEHMHEAPPLPHLQHDGR